MADRIEQPGTIAKAVRIALGVAYAIVFAECFLRLFSPVPVVPRYVMAAPFGIRVNEPNKQYWHSSADYRIQIRTNSKGIRSDVEIPYDKPKGIKRIVVLGDSFGMGYEVSLEDSFLVRMEHALKEAGLPVQVVNLSVSGHGNAEELIMLQEEGLKYHPDLVLLCWNETDLVDNVRCGLFGIEQGKLVRKAATYLPGVEMRKKLERIWGYDWVEAHSLFYCWVREWVSYHVAKPLLVALQTRPSLSAESESAAHAKALRYERDLCLALIRRIDDTSAQAGAKFMVLDILLPHGTSHFESVFPRDERGILAGVPIVSPIDDFRTNCDRLLFWQRSQGHFTPWGCQRVGHVLAQYILEHGLLRDAN